MKKLFLSLALSVCAGGATAGEPIVTTIIARPALGTNYSEVPGVPLFEWRAVTNTVDIPNGQAARISMLRAGQWNGLSFAWVEKNGLIWGFDHYANNFRGDVIQGPARFALMCRGSIGGIVEGGSPPASPPATLLTLERWTVRKATPEQLRQ